MVVGADVVAVVGGVVATVVVGIGGTAKLVAPVAEVDLMLSAANCQAGKYPARAAAEFPWGAAWLRLEPVPPADADRLDPVWMITSGTTTSAPQRSSAAPGRRLRSIEVLRTPP